MNKLKGSFGVSPSTLPSGYIKNPDDPRSEVTEVVRRIYQMALDGYGLTETAAALERDGVFIATNYWRNRGTNRGGLKCTVEPANMGLYNHQKVFTIQEHYGDAINFKIFQTL